MAVKKFRPTTPSRRQMTMATFEEITTNSPEKSLLVSLKKTGGRNAQGKITVRHHGGGAKRKYRIIDFKRNKDGIPAKVATIEYDPNRTAYIALVVYADGEKRYILAPVGLKVGDVVVSGPEADIKPGNTLPLKNMPVGTVVHNIELQAGKGGQILILGAFFMATDYSSSPATSKGKIIFGLGCGLLLFIFRFCKSTPAEWCSFAILLMNVVSPLIERVTGAKSFGEVKK